LVRVVLADLLAVWQQTDQIPYLAPLPLLAAVKAAMALLITLVLVGQAAEERQTDFQAELAIRLQ